MQSTLQWHSRTVAIAKGRNCQNSLRVFADANAMFCCAVCGADTTRQALHTDRQRPIVQCNNHIGGCIAWLLSQGDCNDSDTADRMYLLFL